MCVPWKTRGVLFKGKRVYFHRLKKSALENEKLMLPEWTVSGNGGIFMGNRKKADVRKGKIPSLNGRALNF